MKEETKRTMIRTIGWTIFGSIFFIMFYGTLISITISNAKVETIHSVDLRADDEVVELFNILINSTNQENPKMNLTKALKIFADTELHKKYCIDSGAMYGYFSSGPGGSYGNCRYGYGEDDWKQFSSEEYITWYEKRGGEN